MYSSHFTGSCSYVWQIHALPVYVIVIFVICAVRPHPNECSGSDLDGDLYFVCWDPELTCIRPIKPMSYEPAPTIQLDHDVTIEVCFQELFTSSANTHFIFFYLIIYIADLIH